LFQLAVEVVVPIASGRISGIKPRLWDFRGDYKRSYSVDKPTIGLCSPFNAWLVSK
jgi:hypothetical protein